MMGLFRITVPPGVLASPAITAPHSRRYEGAPVWPAEREKERERAARRYSATKFSHLLFNPFPSSVEPSRPTPEFRVDRVDCLIAFL